MRTKPEIEAIITNRLVGAHLKSVTFDQLLTVMQNASQNQKDRFMDFLLNDNADKAGDMLRKIIVNRAENLAQNEAEAMLEDDNLTLEDIDKLL